MLRSPRFRWVLLICLVVATLIWWLYPREIEGIGFSGTAPNPDHSLARRPRYPAQLDKELVSNVELFLDGEKVDGASLRLQCNQRIKVHGSFQIGDVPTGTFVLDISIAVASETRSPVRRIHEGKAELKPVEKFPKVEFEGEWVLPDHEGEFELCLTCHLARPGEKVVIQRFIKSCPVTLDSADQ